jgi:Flp pilus assembly pilin Flp
MMRHTLGSQATRIQSRLELLFRLGSRAGTEAQELVEYALMAGFVAVSVAALIPYNVSGPLSTIFNKLQGYLITLGGA